jgi:CubicO group peptidase (beta-lactamase class C family)
MKISQDQLRSALEEGLARHRVPGASVAVFHNGKLTTAAAGITNVNTGVEMTPDTVMHIGSITKVFNATLVMQLVDEDVIDLDEKVLRYLPDLKLKDREALEQITVKMLLNHTSGIDGELLPDHGRDEETIEKGIGRFANLGQLHRPGTEFSYCNAATVIAGYLAQRLTGKSWYQLIKERIFAPLSMEHSAALPEDALLYRASVGHYLNPANQQLARTSFAFLPPSFAPAGATLMTSARDLIAFARAHMSFGAGANGTRILSERSAKAMQQITVNNKGKAYTYTDGMGLGWMVSDDGLLFHSGGGPGIVSMLYAYPKHGFAAAVLTNAEHAACLITETIEPWLKELGTMKPFGTTDIREPTDQVTIDPDKYIGVYENVLIRCRVWRDPAGLMLARQVKFAPYDSTSTQETPPMRLIPLGQEKFLLESDGKSEDRSSDAFRIFTFRNPDSRAHMQHLGNILRLYKRVS